MLFSRRSHATSMCFTLIYCDDMLSMLALAPLSAPAPIMQAFVHTFVLGLFLHGLLPESELFSSGLGVSWILFLLAADQEVMLLVSLCSAFLFTKDFSFALSVR